MVWVPTGRVTLKKNVFALNGEGSTAAGGEGYATFVSLGMGMNSVYI